MDRNRKALVIMGAGATLGVGVLLLATRKAKAALPEPAPNGVVVGLFNPPGDAELWQLALCDWDITVSIQQVGGLAHVGVATPITFEIPSGVAFPLRVTSLQVTKWNEAGTALQVLYEIQSFRPYLWDWDKWDWSDEPDPSYRGVFIPDFGSYYYNVAKERFEQ